MADFTSSFGTGKVLGLANWDSQTCDNSLAAFPDNTDFSWGIISLTIDGADSDNYVVLAILDTSYNELIRFTFTTNGKKKVDLSQYTEIGETQDIRVRVMIYAYV